MPMKMSSMKASGNKPMTKGALAQAIADQCGCKRKEVSAFLEAQSGILSKSLSKTGKVTIPGICMVKTRNKPATKARTAEMFGKTVKIAAMKARTVVKAYPVKALKDEYK